MQRDIELKPEKILSLFFAHRTKLLAAGFLAVSASIITVIGSANCAETTLSAASQQKPVLVHPFITRTASGEINNECFEREVLSKLRALKLPPDYPEQRMWRLYSLKPLEIEFVEKLASKLTGKSQDQIACELGNPEVKTGAEGYAAPSRTGCSHWVYFLGFEIVMLDLTFYENKCISASVDGNLENMFIAMRRHRKFIQDLATGKSREEVFKSTHALDYLVLLNDKNGDVSFAAARGLVQQQHNEELRNGLEIKPSNRSMYYGLMRRVTLELTLEDNKCTGANEYFEFH